MSINRIKLLAMDVDGTLTDGRIYIGIKGEVMKAFDVKDGYGITHLRENGIEPVIITGRESSIVCERARELGVTEIHQGVEDKLNKLKEIAATYEICPEEIAYIGDDLNDLACIEYCGLSACPEDSVPEVKSKVDYICKNRGGRGAVREFSSYIVDSSKNA